MNPIINHHLFTERVCDGFIAVNPLIPKGIALINKIQHSVLMSCDGKHPIEEIAVSNNLSTPETIGIIGRFLEKEFVSIGANFTFPEMQSPRSLNLWIHTTNKCTLRCTYCQVHKEQSFMTEETFQALMSKLVESAKKDNLSKITLRFAGGEPMMQFKLLSKYIPVLRNQLEKVGCNLRFAFLTNLTILNREILQFIKENKCGISVSLDGQDSFHDKTRVFRGGGGSFKLVRNNLNTLLNSGIKPFILTVVSEDNLDGLVDHTNFLLDHDLSFRYSFVREKHISNKEEMTSVLLDCYSVIEKKVLQGYKFTKKHKLCDTNITNPGIQVCGAGRGSFAVYTDGTLHTCFTMLDQKKPFGSLYSSNDMLSLSINQDVIPDLHNNNCGGCQYEYICAGGCPIDRINGRSPYCDVFKALIPRVYQLIGLERLYNLTHKE